MTRRHVVDPQSSEDYSATRVEQSQALLSVPHSGKRKAKIPTLSSPSAIKRRKMRASIAIYRSTCLPAHILIYPQTQSIRSNIAARALRIAHAAPSRGSVSWNSWKIGGRISWRERERERDPVTERTDSPDMERFGWKSWNEQTFLPASRYTFSDAMFMSSRVYSCEREREKEKKET